MNLRQKKVKDGNRILRHDLRDYFEGRSKRERLHIKNRLVVDYEGLCEAFIDSYTHLYAVDGVIVQQSIEDMKECINNTLMGLCYEN
jgi:hypothetical protein